MKKDLKFVYGKNPVLESFRSKSTIEKVLIQNTLRGELEKQVRSLCKEHEVPLVKVPVEKLDYLTYKQNHQGVAAYLSPIHFTKLEDVILLAFDQGRSPAILILEGVSDVRNVGAIARSAYVFGVDALVFPMKNSARINEDTVKISAGAILNLPVCRERNMETIIEKCKNFGLKVFATDLQTEDSLDTVSFNEPCAIVLGSEDRGITPETQKAADQLVKIPQFRDFDSLNVSVSAGIVCYEISKQRK